MTRSSGGSRQPNRPNRDDPRRPETSDGDFDIEDNSGNNGASRSRPSRRPSTAGSRAPADSASTEPGDVIDTKRRGIALMADVIVIFAVTMVVSPLLIVVNTIIPFQIFTQQLIMICLLLVRDFIYQGRGIGKNLMGLQVVDYTTNLPPSLLQSVKRNVLFFAPLLVLGFISLLKYLPIDKTPVNVVFEVVKFICSAYVIVVIPLEIWLAFKGQGGRRIGDKFANTHIIQSSMDFSKIN